MTYGDGSIRQHRMRYGVKSHYIAVCHAILPYPSDTINHAVSVHHFVTVCHTVLPYPTIAVCYAVSPHQLVAIYHTLSPLSLDIPYHTKPVYHFEVMCHMF